MGVRDKCRRLLSTDEVDRAPGSQRGRPSPVATAALSTRFHNYGDVFPDGDRCPISEIRRHTWPQRTQRHREEHAAGSALDAAPPGGGRGVPTANERPLARGPVRSFAVCAPHGSACGAGRPRRAPLCLSVSVACPNQYVAVITKFCT